MEADKGETMTRADYATAVQAIRAEYDRTGNAFKYNRDMKELRSHAIQAGNGE